MLRILYISTARSKFTSNEMEQLLRISRRNNASVNVTGLLIAGDNRFLQLLEGPSEQVTATYKRIEADKRHFGTVILSKKAVNERLFSQWDMGYRASALPWGNGGSTEDLDTFISPILDKTVRAYFEGFAKQHAA